MPPKQKESAKKYTPNVVRAPISDSSLCFVPPDALEGYQERLHRCVEWTTAGAALRHHKDTCQKKDNPQITFTEALKTKINRSILRGFLDKNSTLTLQQHYELIVPILLWDNEKCTTEEAQICFKNDNNITDNLLQAIKHAVNLNDRKLLMKQIRATYVLRVTDCKMTCLDEGLRKFPNLVTLNLCGNLIKEIDPSFLSPKLRALEMQSNCVSSLDSFKELPPDLLHLGLSRNALTNNGLEQLGHFPRFLIVLDLSDNDIYDLDPLLDLVVKLPNLQSLLLQGNPCSMCAGYARTVIARVRHLRYLDNREVLPTDRLPLNSTDRYDPPHPHDLRSAYFFFNIIRIISAPMPPKPDKGATGTFFIELELPLLDSIRRKFLMYRRVESLTELAPLPEDYDIHSSSKHTTNSSKVDSKVTSVESEAESEETDIFARLEPKSSRLIQHYTVYESNRVTWNKIMNFQEPTLRLFCPDLVALRDTFRSTITLRLVYCLVTPVKKEKEKSKSVHVINRGVPSDQRLTLATIKCSLRSPDWSQHSQHFFWDESLNTENAIHWGEGDLSVLHYQPGQAKVTKGKPEADPQRQPIPEILTCHFSFGIETLKTA